MPKKKNGVFSTIEIKRRGRRTFHLLLIFLLFATSMPVSGVPLDTASIKTNQDSLFVTGTGKKVPYLPNGGCVGIAGIATILVIFIAVAAATITIGQFNNPLKGEM